MSEIQVCEGVFRQKCGRYVAVIPCERREGGQLWTDGIIHYFNDGTVTFAEGGSVVDLVEYIGPFPYSSQCAPVSRPAETESITAGAGGVSDDPGRIIYDLGEKLKTANATIISQTAEIDRLRAEWRAEFNAAQQLRSEVAQMERLLDEAREKLRYQEAAAKAFDHHCEGMKAAFLATIETLAGVRS